MGAGSASGRLRYEEFVDWVFSDAASIEPATPPIAMDYTQLLPERYEVDIGMRYDLDKTQLGEGGYGCVFVARDKQFKNRRVVVKKVTKTSTPARTEMFRREIQTMKELDHPNICKLLETHEQGRNIYYVMEFLEGGEVFDRIIAQGCISEGNSARIVQQVASALRHAHERSIAHRDIKPENVVFRSKDKADTHVKLIDWGLGISFAGCVMRDHVGSDTYCAPEVMDAKNGMAYTAACDIWSLGVLAYVMLAGRPPFWGSPGLSEMERRKQQLAKAYREEYPLKGQPWDSTSPKAKDFIRRLLKAKPEDRPRIEEVLTQPWLTAETWDTPTKEVEAGILDNLRRFRNNSTVSAMCITAVARQLDHKQLGNIHQVFRKMDKNADGVQSLEEISEGFGEMYGKDNADYQNVMEIFESLDLNKSSKIDYTEFCAGGLAQQTIAQDEACWAAFKTFDIDNTGKISRKEFQKVLESVDLKKTWSLDVCHDVTQALVADYDKDGDGEINFDEFLEYMRTSRKKYRPLGVGGDADGEEMEQARLTAYQLLSKMGGLS